MIELKDSRMNRFQHPVALMACCLPLFAMAQPAITDAQARAQTKPLTARKIILVGDSTTAVVGGWGPSFCAYHLSSFTACINLARGGRSTFNYRAEGSWAIALAEMKSGGFKDSYVLIQFGHNDQPGKPGRSTDLATEFPQNLAAYVAEVRAAGAKPVLVTPLTRRGFKNGQLDNDLAPWAAAIRKVATELNVPLVDLYARSQEAVQALGAADSTRFAQLPPSPEVLAAAKTGSTISAATGVAPAASAPVANLAALEPMGQAKLAFDYTHLGRAGADFFAKLVTLELARAVPELRNDLIP
jgi:lysophospholipase L1-like esterase